MPVKSRYEWVFVETDLISHIITSAPCLADPPGAKCTLRPASATPCVLHHDTIRMQSDASTSRVSHQGSEPDGCVWLQPWTCCPRRAYQEQPKPYTAMTRLRHHDPLGDHQREHILSRPSRRPEIRDHHRNDRTKRPYSP